MYEPHGTATLPTPQPGTGAGRYRIAINAVRLPRRGRGGAHAATGPSRATEPEPPGSRSAHCIECRPSMLPSVSTIIATKPYGPIENLSRNTLPPAASARDASTAQSSQPK